MLAFLRQQMIGDAQQTVDRNRQTHFFERFANRASLDGFQKIHFATDDAPTRSFWWKSSQGEQHSAALIDQENTRSHARLRAGVFECFRGLHRSCFETHFATEGSGTGLRWDKSDSTLSCTMTISCFGAVK